MLLILFCKTYFDKYRFLFDIHKLFNDVIYDLFRKSKWVIYILDDPDPKLIYSHTKQRWAWPWAIVA